jgi:hypothetical protein
MIQNCESPAILANAGLSQTAERRSAPGGPFST